MATATYSASLITRKKTSSSNAKSGYACQEFYDSSYNYVGVICFSGMALANKVITGISITAVSQAAGYGAGHTKTVYVRKSNYQSTSAGATGVGYAGDALGTFTGSFYTLQTNMLDVTSKMGNSDYQPILLPCGNVPKQHASRVIRLMVATLTDTLLNPQFRDILATLPGRRVRLLVEAEKWGLVAFTESGQKTLLVQPFSQRKGSLLAAATNAIEHGDLKTPEGRAKMIREVFDGYLQYLPDYQLLDNDELELKEE